MRVDESSKQRRVVSGRVMATFFDLLGRSVFGGLLVYSGAVHLVHPFAFAAAVAAYELVPTSVTSAVAFLLPALQITVGVGMILFRQRTLFVATAALMFAAFTAAQGIVLVSGREIACGCFGLGSKPISAQTIAVPMAGLLWSGAWLTVSRFCRSRSAGTAVKADGMSLTGEIR